MIGRRVGAAGAIGLLAGCVAAAPASSPTQGASPTAIESGVHRGVNEFRASVGLPDLALDPVLTRLARGHSAQMAAGARPFGHDGFEHRAARARSVLGTARLAENVAVNNYPLTVAAERIVTGWIESPGHLRNLRGDFTIAGVGAARSADGETYVTQLYAAP